MLGDPIDPSPFEPAMPAAVRDAIAMARQGRGAAAEWLVARGRGWGQVGTTVTLLRDPRIAPEVAGWLAGIAMFGDDTDRVAEALEGHAGVRAALDAFVAGIKAGVATTPGQWARIERLTSASHPGLAAILPVAAGSEDTAIRATARRLARKLGRDAQVALDAARTATTGAQRRRLAAAGSALAPKLDADGERGALLLRLLDGWRTTRARELEAPIARLGAELARTRDALADKSREALEEKWCAVARRRDPVDVSRLLEASWPKHLDAARRRVDQLAKFLPDPRITLGVATSAAKHRSESSLRFHRAVAQLVLAAPMREAVHLIDAIVDTHDAPEIVEIYEEVRALCAGTASQPADPALLSEVEQARSPWSDLDALWASHVADPTDLGHRAVLADALQRAGDPRGEFIALQLAPPSADARLQIAKLLRANADVWTGPIPLVSKSSRRFERGFLVALSCRGTGPELSATFARPEWVTVEDLQIDGAGCVLAQLVRRMPVLRRLATPHADLLIQLARTGKYPAIEALACERGWLPPRSSFPNLKVMAARWQTDIGELHTAAAQLGLHAISHLGLPVDEVATVLAARQSGPPEVRCALGDGGGFAGFATGGWRIRAFRDRREVELAWAGGPAERKAQKDDVLRVLARAFLTVREVKQIELASS